MLDLHSRLEQFLDSQGITKQSIELKFGMSNGSLGKSIRNKASFGVGILENILIQYPLLSAEWLLRGEGEMLRNSKQVNTLHNNSIKESYLNNELPMTLEERKRLELLEQQVANLIKSNSELTSIIKEVVQANRKA